MNIEQYLKYKEEIEPQNYHKENRNLFKGIVSFGWFGSFASVFFAFFIVNKFMSDAIVSNVSSSPFIVFIGILFSVLFLVFFELTKRYSISSASKDVVLYGFKFKNKFLTNLLFTLLLISGSFYFSLNGAKEFSSKFAQIEETILIVQDSTINLISSDYDQKTEIIENDIIKLKEDNEKIRESNYELMKKRDNLPDNWITSKHRYTEIIDNNNGIIEKNDQQIKDLEKRIKLLEEEKNNKITKQEKKSKETIDKEKNENLKSIILFICISTIIELIVIFGVYYRKYYIYKSYGEYKSEFEPLLNKIGKYKNFIKIIYKNGRIQIGEPVIGNKQLQQELMELGLDYQDSVIIGFYKEMQILNNLKWLNGEWHTIKDYQDALKSISLLKDEFKPDKEKTNTVRIFNKNKEPETEQKIEENVDEIKKGGVVGTGQDRLNKRIGK